MLDIVSANPSVDVIVVAGDLTTRGSTEEADRAITSLLACNKPLIAVAGNMDPPHLENVLVQRGISLNGRGVLIGRVGFCGVSAAPFSPLDTPYEISEEEIAKRSLSGWRMIDSVERKGFVPHSPPFNTKLDVIRSGQHVGSTSVRRFIEEHQPDVVICGHIHEAQGVDTIGRTTIINCGPAQQGFHGLVELGETVRAEIKP